MRKLLYREKTNKKQNYEGNYPDHKHYPPYASGGSSVISYDLAFWLGTSSSRYRYFLISEFLISLFGFFFFFYRMLNCDDAALGVWLAALQNARIGKNKTKNKSNKT